MIEPPPAARIAAPLGNVDVLDSHPADEIGGIVHQYVELAEFVEGALDGGLAGCRVGDVAFLADDVAARRANLGGGLLDAVAVDIGDHKGRALGAETLGGRPPDAAHRPRDNPNLALKSSH